MKDILYVLGKYISKHKRIILIHMLIIFIYGIVFYLYSLPVVAVGYAALISFTAAFLFIIYDFIQFYKRHITLHDLTEKVTVSLNELPKEKNLLEADYNKLIDILYNHAYKISSESEIKYNELIDYYTLWVHQIKTPISAMRLLLQTETSLINKKLLQELFKIECYVEMVLQYLRLESLSSDLVLQYYDLSNIINKAVKKYATVFIYNKTKPEIVNINCQVLTDEKWLIFVIEQLISNALKYTNNGKISIYMDNTALKTLVIEDTGIGIRKEDLPRIFERGFTGYNGRMNKKSTGLGLYLSNRILKKLSHKINITSSVGTGTKVFLDLYREKSTTLQ